MCIRDSPVSIFACLRLLTSTIARIRRGKPRNVQATTGKRTLFNSQTSTPHGLVETGEKQKAANQAQSAGLTTVCRQPPPPPHTHTHTHTHTLTEGALSVVWEPEETLAAGTSPARGTREDRKTGCRGRHQPTIYLAGQWDHCQEDKQPQRKGNDVSD